MSDTVIKEYGESNKDVMILLHGGGLADWNYTAAAKALQNDYHVIIPILDGHSGGDSDFTSIESNADEIIAYIDEKFGGKVLLMGGLSLGGQILLDILAKCSDICNFAVIESALVCPMKMTARLIAPSLKLSYGFIKKRWFSKLQFRSLKLPQNLFDDYYRDSCAISRQNMTAFLKANANYTAKSGLSACHARVLVLVGGKERRIMKKSAERICKMIPKSKLCVQKGCYHGEISINKSAEYASMITAFIKGGAAE